MSLTAYHVELFAHELTKWSSSENVDRLSLLSDGRSEAQIARHLSGNLRKQWSRKNIALFESASDRSAIRNKLLDDGMVDSVIGLPANLFYSTGIPVCVLVLKKCKRHDDVLFINAAGPESFQKGKRQNLLLEEHIAKFLETYRERKEESRYSRRVGMAEIRMNLNISRYVRTAEAEMEIDLAEVHAELVAADAKIKAATSKHNGFLKELGLLPLP